MRRLVVTVVALLLPLAAQAQEAAEWIGRAPHELVQAQAWQGAFVVLMGPEGLDRLHNAVVIAEPIAQQGDWVVAVGCAPHQCGDVMGGVAISVTDGRLLAAVRDEAGVTVWGEGDLPPGLQGIVSP